MSEWLELASGGRKKKNPGDYHNLKYAAYDGGLENLDWIGSSIIFTVVRHPFDRMLSAYEDKIARIGDVGTRMNFCSRYGLDYNDDISLSQFLTCISSDPDRHSLDPHWRPQSNNLVFPFIVPNFICRLEYLGDDFSDFLKAIERPDLGLPGHQHKVNRDDQERAAKIRNLIADPKLFEMAFDLYQADFRNFSYQPNVDEGLKPRFSPRFSPHTHPRVGRLAKIVRPVGDQTFEDAQSRLDLILRNEILAGDPSKPTEVTQDEQTAGSPEHASAIGLGADAARSDRAIAAKISDLETHVLRELCNCLRVEKKQASAKAFRLRATYAAEIESDDAASEKLAYILANPVKSCLTLLDYKFHEWLSALPFIPHEARKRLQKAALKRRQLWL